MPITTIINRFTGSSIRNEKMEGREYIVAPMVMITAGVHAGNNGPLLYPEQELSKSARSWNHKPVVVYHPTLNGKALTACDPAVISAQKVGLIMNSVFQGKLRAEAWLESHRLQEVDSRVVDYLNNQQMMEVSTGLDSDVYEEEGDFKGKHYTGVVHNIRPDHLALLPDMKGACSIEDGAGLLQLNASYQETLSDLSRALRERWGQETWVMDAWDGTVVYEREGKLYSLSFSIGENNLAILGDDGPDPVRRQTIYRAESGDIIGNAIAVQVLTAKDLEMEKTALINALITNQATSWAETDRKTLEGFDEEQLKKMLPVERTPVPGTVNQTGVPSILIQTGNVVPPGDPAHTAMQQGGAQLQPQQTQNAQVPPLQQMNPVTLEQYLAPLPVAVQNVLRAGVTAFNTEKARLIGIITANANNKFTPQFLETIQDLDQLHGMAALCGAGIQNAPPSVLVTNYGGQAVPGALQTQDTHNAGVKAEMEDGGLDAPTINWGELSNVGELLAARR